MKTLIEPLIKPMSEAYLEVFNMATNSDKSKKKREFFGLRDFYRLIVAFTTVYKVICFFLVKVLFEERVI